MREDLTRPLGLKPKRKPLRREFIVAAAAGGVVIAIAVVALGMRLYPSQRGPTAVAVINAPTSASSIVPDRTASTKPAAPAEGLTEMEPDGDLGDVGRVVIHDPSAEPAMKLASLPQKDLVETSQSGPLPRVSTAGRRPLDAYARPSDAGATDMRIAIVIGGMGLDDAGTRQAIANLPGSVTFAFAPYGDNLGADTAAARAAGHEMLLQIPLEPFNYPKTDPGPNTLTLAGPPEENETRLHWLLGRMTNYVGVVNYMGAKFTGDIATLAPVVDEIGQRGLLYLDDGSSARSRAAEAAGTTTPFLRADLVLDADLSAEAIDDRLTQLRAIARERGYAIATATAFPITIERVAAFAKATAGKGVTLVPVTALLPARP